MKPQQFKDADASVGLIAPDNLTAESQPHSRTKAIQDLLNCIESVGTEGLDKVCVELGWTKSAHNSPKQKHYKVAIIHTVIETAKKHNWHIIHDAGFFYIFDGAYWVALHNGEVKEFLKNAAIDFQINNFH